MSYEQQYTIPLLKSLKFVRRPVEVRPSKEDTLALTDCGTRERADRYIPGFWRGGLWRKANGHPLKIQPTHWTEMVDVPEAERA